MKKKIRTRSINNSLFLILGGLNIFNLEKLIYDIINDISRGEKC